MQIINLEGKLNQALQDSMKQEMKKIIDEEIHRAVDSIRKRGSEVLAACVPALHLATRDYSGEIEVVVKLDRRKLLGG